MKLAGLGIRLALADGDYAAAVRMVADNFGLDAAELERRCVAVHTTRSVAEIVILAAKTSYRWWLAHDGRTHFGKLALSNELGNNETRVTVFVPKGWSEGLAEG